MADAKQRFPIQDTQGRGKHSYAGEDVQMYDPKTGKNAGRGVPLEKIETADLGQVNPGEVHTPVGNADQTDPGANAGDKT